MKWQIIELFYLSILSMDVHSLVRYNLWKSSTAIQTFGFWRNLLWQSPSKDKVIGMCRGQLINLSSTNGSEPSTKTTVFRDEDWRKLTVECHVTPIRPYDHYVMIKIILILMTSGTMSFIIPKLKNMEEGLLSPHWPVTTRITPSLQTFILSASQNTIAYQR